MADTQPTESNTLPCNTTETALDKLETIPAETSKSSKPKAPSSPPPSHITKGQYAALMETNGHECESWYYLIRVEGNKDALQHLQDQLEKVEWYIIDDLSTFDLDLEHLVSAQTAKEMTKLDLNSCSFHRKFDGKLKKINFKFKTKDLKNDERMMGKVFDLLGYGQIEDYIDDEDIDSEDLVTDSSSGTETEDESTESEEEKPVKKLNRKNLPAAIGQIEIPRAARKKQTKAKRA